ncbi:hypothetical protein LUZ62_075029 [Rhynchospora pubera]|uniref:Uncharacterized protein n=1 Tax=Rhynchospora pubera TaxID=906938 RepID=A0AAV8D9G5_9POAL|nr:hypothetical protein LUZ62_075029 [Rhynchospora pubera]
MASLRIPLTFLFLSGLMVLGMVQNGEALCTLMCVPGSYITCKNYPDQQLYGCSCACAPPDGEDCEVHFPDGHEKCKD